MKKQSVAMIATIAGTIGSIALPGTIIYGISVTNNPDFTTQEHLISSAFGGTVFGGSGILGATVAIAGTQALLGKYSKDENE